MREEGKGKRGEREAKGGKEREREGKMGRAKERRGGMLFVCILDRIVIYLYLFAVKK